MENKEYEGWELVKLASEGKLNVHDKFHTDRNFEIEVREDENGQYFTITNNGEEVPVSFFVSDVFIKNK